MAVIECLRFLVPVSDLVETMAYKLVSYPKPQMVGLMLEYLVAFAFVANLHPSENHQIRSFS
jgi:hypothetical protein